MWRMVIALLCTRMYNNILRKKLEGVAGEIRFDLDGQFLYSIFRYVLLRFF